MTTTKQIDANRRNAQNSTGPRTAEAKARSSQNALRHGLTARKPVLPDEDREAYARHQRRLAHELKPAGYFEELLVDQITDLIWRLRRVPGLEAMVIRAEMDGLRETEISTAGTRRRQIDDLQILQKFDTEQEKRAQRQNLALWVGKAFSLSLQSGAIDRLASYETRMLRELERLLAMLSEHQEQRKKDQEAPQKIIDVEIEESGDRKHPGKPAAHKGQRSA